jgi:periplasmic protein TonB
MAYKGQISGRHRTLSAGATLLAAALIGFGLVSGLDLHIVKTVNDRISAVAISAPKPPEQRPEVEPATDKATEASPANHHAKSAPVQTPKPKVIPPTPPVIAAAPQPRTGQQASSGSSPTGGPGSGAGGAGAGSGGGGSKAVWSRGEIRNRDYPKSASRAKVGGVVEVRFTIQPNGRVTNCRISRSSGDISLDTTTCNLIELRFRFKPATNATGVPITSDYGWRQTWWLEGRR